MAKVTIRYWAAAKDAAGVAAESVQADTLAEALAAVIARHGEASRLRSVLATSSFLVDGAPAAGAAPTTSCSGRRRSLRCCRSSPAAETADLTGWVIPPGLRHTETGSVLQWPHMYVPKFISTVARESSPGKQA